MLTKYQNQIFGPVLGSSRAIGDAKTVTNDQSHSPLAFNAAPTWRYSSGEISGAYCQQGAIQPHPNGKRYMMMKALATQFVVGVICDAGKLSNATKTVMRAVQIHAV